MENEHQQKVDTHTILILSSGKWICKERLMDTKSILKGEETLRLPVLQRPQPTKMILNIGSGKNICGTVDIVGGFLKIDAAVFGCGTLLQTMHVFDMI